MKSTHLFAASCIALAFAAVGTAPATAQTAASQDDASMGAGDAGAIIVTARRRDEQLQDVPIAITALSSSDLTRNGIVDVQQLNYATPSLQVAATAFGSSVPGYAIRGQRQIESILSQDPSVGVYFADVVQQRTHGTNQVLYDLESVQVLKGPQGTLFGRNTTGGAVLITPAKPELGAIKARLSGTVGNYDLYGGEVMLNMSESDVFGIRGAAKVRYHDGYGENIATGGELNDMNMESFRVSMLWEPSSTFSTYTVGSYYNYKDNGFLYTPSALNPNSFLALFYPSLYADAQASLAAQKARSPYKVAYDAPTFTRTETWSVSNTTSLDLSDNVTLKNIVGYRKVDNALALDYDALPQLIFDTRNTLDAKQFTEELQLLGTAMEDRLNYILGGYYFRESGEDIQISRSNFDTIGASREGIIVNRSYSLFAQGDFKITDQFTLTAGLRQTWDKRKGDNRSRQSAGGPYLSLCRLQDENGVLLPPDQCSVIQKASFDKLTYLITLAYEPNDDMLFYATHNTGYRSGGIYLRWTKPIEAIPFRPEEAKNYEVGTKLSLLDRKMTINAAAFYTDYKDIQRTVQPQCDGICSTVLNAASATIKGFEVETSVRPTPWLSFGGFIGYTDASYDKFILPSGADISDNKFAFVPKASWGLNGTVTLPVGAASEASASLNYYHQSSMQGSDINDFDPIPGYGLLNGNISLTNVGNSGIDATFFMNNITDKTYYPASIDVYASLGHNGYSVGDPRTYGITLTAHLGD